MRALFLAVLLRDLRLAARRRIDALLPLVFFIVAISLFPLGVGPEPQTLRHIAPGIVWVCALLATMLSVQHLYAGDQADGSLEQLLLAPHPAVAVATAKCVAHWLVNGWPLIVAAPLVGVLFDLSAPALRFAGHRPAAGHAGAQPARRARRGADARRCAAAACC